MNHTNRKREKDTSLVRSPQNDTVPHGWLIIDKPLGVSSAQVVGRVKKLLQLPRKHKIGHAGTLDPLASGGLPLAIGEATKLVQYVMDGRKGYRFTVKWGEATSTDDTEGEVIETSDVIPSAEAIEEVLSQFTGVIQQTPPAYSAIKVDGKRAYAMARAGEEVQLKPRDVQIETITLQDDSESEAAFSVICGKGTYVRSLARDIAKALGTCGHVTHLRRTAVGPFLEKDYISLDLLEKIVHEGALKGKNANDFLLPIETGLDDIPAVSITEQAARALFLGQTIAVNNYAEGLHAAFYGDELIAMVEITQQVAKSLRVFNHSSLRAA